MHITRLKSMYIIKYLILLTLLTFSALISITNANAIKKNKEFEDENILYRFMRDNYKFETYAAALGLDKDIENSILKDLPFRNLFYKLKQKLMNLAIEESKMATAKGNITQEMQNMMMQLITEPRIGFDRALVIFHKQFKKYTNIADLVTLEALSLYDAKDIAALLKEFDDNEETKKIKKELITIMFNDAIENYKKFITHNKKIFNSISSLADNKFKIEKMEKKCIQFFGHEYCNTNQKSESLKNFSEIIPYVMENQK